MLGPQGRGERQQAENRDKDFSFQFFREPDEIGDENAGDNQQATHIGQSAPGS